LETRVLQKHVSCLLIKLKSRSILFSSFIIC